MARRPWPIIAPTSTASTGGRPDRSCRARPARAGIAAGARFLFDAGGNPVAALAGEDDPPAAVRAGLAPLDEKPRPAEVNGWAYLPTPPRVRLVIVGAGHVGRAVAELAARVDFAVWVVDDRPDVLAADRFPRAARRLLGPIGPTLAGLTITPTTYALIVTRGHGHDQEALGLLAATPAAYVGMIGSRRKVREITDALRDLGLPDAARPASPPPSASTSARPPSTRSPSASSPS